MAAPGIKSHTTPVTTAMPELNGVKTDDSCTFLKTLVDSGSIALSQQEVT
jgi:hypothetical protein